MFFLRKIVAFQLLIRFFIIFNSHGTIVHGFGINLMKVPDEDISQVICSMALLRKYYNSGESLSGSVLYMSLTTASMHTQKKLLKAIHTIDDYPWTIVVRDPKNSKLGDSNVVLHEKPQCYFVIIENLEDEDLEDIFDDWKTTINWNPLAQFVVYLSSVEETDEEMTELMIEILLNFMNKKIFNVNVIGQNEENGYYYGKTAFPYDPDNNCGNRVISIEILDVCDYQVLDRTGHRNDSSVDGDDPDSGEYDDADGDGGFDEPENSNDGEDNGGNNNDEENKYDDKNENDSKKSGEEKENDENTSRKNNDDGDGSEQSKESNNNDDEIGEFLNGMELNENENIKSSENALNDYKKDVKKDFNRNNYNLRRAVARLKLSRSKFFNKKNHKIYAKYENISSQLYYPNDDSPSFKNDKNNTYPPKFMGLETSTDSEISDENIMEKQADERPHFFFEEVFRALFLDKFPKDLSGCPLAAAYRPWEPYIFTERPDSPLDYPDENVTLVKDKNFTNTDPTIYDENEQNFQFDGLSEYATEETNSVGEDNQETSLSGIEYQLLKIIGECLHIRIDLQVENSNLYQLFQELIDGDIEMLIGGIDEDPSMSQFVSATIPYHQDDLTWCVAKARRSHSLFNFLASFSLVVWLVTFLFIFVTSLNITWTQQILSIQGRNKTGFFNIAFRVFGNIFNQSMPISNKRKPMRLVFSATFFMGLIFMNAYQSFLISTLTTPKSAYQIKSIEEIYQHRMIIKGSVDNVRHLNKEGVIYKYIRKNFEMCYDIEECLMEAAESDNIAVAVSRQHSFYNPRIPRNRLYCFDRNENIYIYLVTMLLPKKFHLLHKINPVIQYVIESGHMQKWARDLDMRRRIREERNRAHEDTVRSLTLDQVIGTFVFTGTLLAIAFIVLMLEICVYRLATKRHGRRLRIAKFLHRQFLRA